MAKLTDEELNEAREYIRTWELDKLNQWMIDHKIVIDRKVVISTFKKLEITDSSDKAIEMFDAVFIGMDPAVDRVTSFIRKVLMTGVAAAFIAGLTGGFWFLTKTVLKNR